MKKTLTLCTLFLFVTMPLVAYAENTETWTARITESQSACKSIGKDIIGVYDLKVEYGEGNTLTVTGEKSQHIYNGVLVETSPESLILKTSYLEDAGIVTENVTITFADNKQGTGSGKWYWSDGLMSCGGSYQFTITK